jgi:hypothetical protein
MEKAPPDHQKVLQELDRMLDEAPDEASREEIRRLRNSLTAPEMIEMARAARKNAAQRSSNPVLEFHDPLLPSLVTATGGVIATAVCLYAVALGFQAPTVVIGQLPLNPWIVAVFAGAFSVAFTALSVTRAFSIASTPRACFAYQRQPLAKDPCRCDAVERHPALRERPDRVLEVRPPAARCSKSDARRELRDPARASRQHGAAVRRSS